MIKSPILKYLLPLSLAVFSLGIQAKVTKSRCLSKGNTVCQKIIKLHPKMDHKEAYKLSNIFYIVAKKYKLDTDLLLSIAFQESRFKIDTIRNIKGLYYDAESKAFKEVKIGADFCMMQIHFSNIRKMDLDATKLITDPKYCIETGAKILSTYKKKHEKTEIKWWTRYNAVTDSKREIYYNHVSRHLSKLQPQSTDELVEQDAIRTIASSVEKEKEIEYELPF